MIDIQTVNDRICCFKVPYKDIFVAIYILKTDKGAVLFDTAACDCDVDEWIAPALQQLGITPTHIFISHNHTDHAGGVARAAALWPDAVILSRSEKLRQDYSGKVHCPEDGEIVLDSLQVVTIPGHTVDSAALLDRQSNTLVSGDCLQSYGIFGSGYWYGAITLTAEHYAAVRKLRSLPIENIATAHDYHPVGMISYGKDAVAARLDSSIGALERIRSILEVNSRLGDEQIAEICNDGQLPKVAPRVVAAMRKAVAEGGL